MFENVGQQTVWSRLAGCAVGLGVAVAAFAACAGAGFWWWNRVPDQAPPVSYGLAIAEGPVGGVDLVRVHRELWPAWSVAHREDARADAADALATALAADPGLASIAKALTDPGAGPDAVADQVGQWNAALAARGASWALGAGYGGGSAYVKSYRVLARPTVAIGGREVPVRIALRADDLNVAEGWLGLSEDVGEAIVVVDRIGDFAFDVLWPDLDPASTDPLAPAIAAAARDALGADAASRLASTAPARRAMVAAREAVYARRERCGSDFGVRFGWSGLDQLGLLYAWAEAEHLKDCPGITAAEADALARGTLRIRRDPALPDALEALVGWAARGVAIHEARHQLDHEDWGLGTPPPCEGCSGSDRARVEESAYASAFASDDGLVAWVQGCDVIRGDPSSSREALLAVADGMGISCDQPPPPDLRDRAAALSRRWFGRDEGASIRDLPARVPFALAPR